MQLAKHEMSNPKAGLQDRVKDLSILADRQSTNRGLQNSSKHLANRTIQAETSKLSSPGRGLQDDDQVRFPNPDTAETTNTQA